MKTIDTLVTDIYSLFGPTPHKVTPENAEKFGKDLGTLIASRMGERQKPSLRLSNLGSKCKRKLWYEINKPELAEELPPWVRIKFLFGDILEHLLLFLSREAGHKVEGEQDTLYIGDVKGHRDAVIDGRTVDVKSASTYSFKKFKDHGLADDDPFGYIDQLGCYVSASASDPLVEEKDVGSFLAIDKTLGHITLDTYPKPDKDYERLSEEIKELLLRSDPPARGYEDVPEGKSGNRKLCTACSYCAFKHTCWPNLRVFGYSTGPVYLTRVERKPKVSEFRS